MACALGVESATPRVLALIDKGAPVSTVRDDHRATSPTPGSRSRPCASPIFRRRPTARRWTRCASSRSCARRSRSTSSASSTSRTARWWRRSRSASASRETCQLDGDLLGTGLFYEEPRPSKRGAERRQARRGARSAVGGLAACGAIRGPARCRRRTPSCTTSASGRACSASARRLPRDVQPFGAARGEAQRALRSRPRSRAATTTSCAIWHQLVREQRHVSRAAYHALAAALPPLLAAAAPLSLRRRRAAGRRSRARRKGRRPPNASNAAG